MSAPFRFLGLALFAWVGVRAASLGFFPGATALASPATSTTASAPPAMTRYDGVMTSSPYYPASPYAAATADHGQSAYAPLPYPYGYAAIPQPVQTIVLQQPRPRNSRGAPRTADWGSFEAMPQPLSYAPVDNLDWPVPTGIADAPTSHRRTPGAAPPPPQRFDRWQFSTWAMMRNSPGPSSLATGGMLGGSQGGARLTYRFNSRVAATARFSSALGGRRGAEAALGLRWQPLASVPVAFNLERRQGLGRFGGRSDFAAYLEGGVYGRPVTGKLVVDGYAQAGLVGHRSRDWFADGALTLSHPLWKRMSGGIGVWAGGQREGNLGALYRVDAGPRLSVDLYRGTRLHVDYRQRLVGNALPGSGPTVTFAGDF